MRAKGNKVTVQRKTVVQEKDDMETLIHLMQPKLPKSLYRNNPFPLSMERKLLFQFDGLIQGSSPFLIKEFRLNSAYSPDGVGTPSGYNELNAIYNFSKVISGKFYYRLDNNETTYPIIFGIVIRDIQPSVYFTTYTKAQGALEVAPTTRSDIIGQASGQPRFESKEFKIDCASVIGNRLEYLASPLYSCDGATQPNQAIWIALILLNSQSSVNLTNGAFVNICLELRTKFYSLKSIES